MKALLQWSESLDPEAKMGIKGLTLMNEPAHSNAWTHFAKAGLSFLKEVSSGRRDGRERGPSLLFLTDHPAWRIGGLSK